MLKKKLKNYWIRNFSPTSEKERIITLYNKGKKKYYINCVIINTIGNIFIFYLGVTLMKINLLHLSGIDYLYLFFLILMQLFIIKNIFIPIVGNWNIIENKYNEVVESKIQKEDFRLGDYKDYENLK